MHKSRTKTFRPDKVVMQRRDEDLENNSDSNAGFWQCISAEIMGTEVRDVFAEKGETAEQVF